MKRFFSALIAFQLAALLLTNTACSGDKSYYSGTPRPIENPDPPKQPEPLIKLPAAWVKNTELMAGFPEGIEVYRNTTPINSKAVNAYCVVFDPTNANLELKPALAAANKKPSAFVAAESSTVYACINAGFFGTNISYSLVQYNNVIEAVNIRSLSRPLNGTNTTYYPTRGAFGLTANNTPQVTWIYHVGTGNGTIYSYPAPSANKLNTAPQPVPSAAFPEGGAVWNVKNAIGGSPVLINNNTIKVTDAEELIDIDNNSARGRSAIGYTASNKVILLAVEGNNASGGAGLSLSELAQLMKDMGCVGALNLDGGGSTHMLVNGKATVKPSDAAGERAVMSVLMLKKK